ncbi:hypothetical protein K458DRAFT_400371 [Lentithecium fluviatile CBS 122367]|uniref:Uncharacterized protein n=1 Tax=Lentithecium fluviatile CBS 122367 TaxID=1168545 RepID=A0A6G1JHM3_9PLEO|nr:hypothetical protein K458DRAFT_400371 [Lentithecium fluviatile CBS 122367]
MPHSNMNETFCIYSGPMPSSALVAVDPVATEKAAARNYECTVRVPSRNIKKALNNPQPQLLRMPRLDPTRTSQRMKFAPRYGLDTLEAKPPLKRPVLRRSRPSGEPLQLIHTDHIYVPAPIRRGDQRPGSSTSSDIVSNLATVSNISSLSKATILGSRSFILERRR